MPPATALLLTFYWHPHLARLRGTVVVLDAAGLTFLIRIVAVRRDWSAPIAR